MYVYMYIYIYSILSDLHCQQGPGDIQAWTTAQNHVWVHVAYTTRICVHVHGLIATKDHTEVGRDLGHNLGT